MGKTLTPKQIEDARYALTFLWADYETMSTDSDQSRARSVKGGLDVLEGLLQDARLAAKAAAIRKGQKK